MFYFCILFIVFFTTFIGLKAHFWLESRSKLAQDRAHNGSPTPRPAAPQASEGSACCPPVRATCRPSFPLHHHMGPRPVFLLLAGRSLPRLTRLALRQLSHMPCSLCLFPREEPARSPAHCGWLSFPQACFCFLSRSRWPLAY